MDLSENESGSESKSVGAARSQRKKLLTIVIAVLVAVVIILPLYWYFFMRPEASNILDPKDMPKFVNELTGPPPVYVPTVVVDPVTGDVIAYNYTVDASEFMQQILPSPLPMTKVWGYGGLAKDPVTGELLEIVSNSPGPTFEALKGLPVNVHWVNNISSPHMFPVDPTLHWADPNHMHMHMAGEEDMVPFPPGYPEAQSPVPLVPHLHGAEVQSSSDGNPDAWFTYDGMHGVAYNTTVPTEDNAAVYHYPNTQPATTLWYHDHALGITRLNVMAGLAGFYLLRDANDTIAPLLPSGKYEIPLVIQDRSFNKNGSLSFTTEGDNPDIHPYWGPEFFGDVIMVNGKVWPNMNVDQGQYRFRLLDGSNARFYNLTFSNGMPFTQIGSDGGYLKSAVTLSWLLIAPGERADLLVDFSGLAPGTKVVLTNSANAPFPDGDPADPDSTGVIMQFTVTSAQGYAPNSLPSILNSGLAGAFPSLPTPSKTRILTLIEVQGEEGPLEILLDGQKWVAAISENPILGSVEEWVIANPTMDTHPIHLHLVQFQIVSRQMFDAEAYFENWTEANGEPPLDHPTINIDLAPFLRGEPMGPPPNEQGWKDTIKMNPMEVTTIRIHFGPIDGSANYTFDATSGPGYVWHCHILDHEDNEMMRPYLVAKP